MLYCVRFVSLMTTKTSSLRSKISVVVVPGYLSNVLIAGSTIIVFFCIAI